MVKLYPPHIEGTIPAFYGDSITVPFSMNRAISRDEFNSFSLLIKTIQTGQQIEVVESKDFNLDDNTVTFKLTKSYDVGQSYKLQLAYKKDANIGYYSTVGISKYTKQPTVQIKDLNKNSLNYHIYNYVGEYITEDITEKMYSCQFKVFNQNDELIQDSGEIIHNSLNDEAAEKIEILDTISYKYKAYEQFDLVEELETGKNYYIQFFVKTIGLMELSTPKYQIIQSQPIPLQSNINLNTTLNYDEGYIDISVKSLGSLLTGKYALARTSSKNNFKSWDEIMRFTLSNESQRVIWKDFTIEQGIEYQYSIFMIDGNNKYSTKVLSDKILADFEDMFLFDGDKQLKIRFNPKVGTFRQVKLETKSDTIGSKYPYIFRNGYVDYKEFQISGLITHLSDNEGYFEYALAQKKYNDSYSNAGEGKYYTQLNADNIHMEREFKLKVLEWLTNGKPKLFRSPAEGNYIVRLMNVSLSPTDSLGRMLHTFSSTAYEIADYTHKNLIQLELIKDNLLIGVNKIIQTSPTAYIQLSQLNSGIDYIKDKALNNITGISFIVNSNKNHNVLINDNVFNVKLSPNLKTSITSLKKFGSDDYDDNDYFLLTKETSVTPPINTTISSIDIKDIPTMIFCGKNDIYKSLNIKNNLMTKLINSGNENINQIFSIKCIPRKISSIYTKDWTSFYPQINSYTDQITSFSNDCIYQVYHSETGALIGYKDGNDNLKLEDWNLNTPTDLQSISIVDSKGNTILKKLVTKEIEITDKDIDFSDHSNLKVYGSLMLKILFTCRLSSINYTVEDTTYKNLLNIFENLTDINSQSDLDELLSKIFSYQGR